MSFTLLLRGTVFTNACFLQVVICMVFTVGFLTVVALKTTFMTDCLVTESVLTLINEMMRPVTGEYCFSPI
jgi:hypothetical protein